MKNKIFIKDLSAELMNLYFQDGSFNTNEIELYEGRVAIDTDTGSELYADELVNEYAEGVYYPNEDKFDLEEYRVEHRVSSSKFKDRGLYWSPEDQALTVFQSYRGTESLNSAALFEEDFTNTYEPDFEEQLQDEVNFMHSDFITNEQKDLNFNFYMTKLSVANNLNKLRIIRESVFAGQKGCWFFMKPAQLKQFWSYYRNKRNYLNDIIKSQKK